MLTISMFYWHKSFASQDQFLLLSLIPLYFLMLKKIVYYSPDYILIFALKSQQKEKCHIEKLLISKLFKSHSGLTEKLTLSKPFHRSRNFSSF